MIEIYGEYNSAKVFTDNIENSAIGQIKALCNQSFSKDSKIRIMPDVHTGKGCTIGTTMTIDKYIVPNLVGADIGCGILTVQLKEKRVDLPKLDSQICVNVPSGIAVHNNPLSICNKFNLEELICYDKINTNNIYNGIGTLGSGNHFIEIDKDDDNNLYLVIHTGSRKLGAQVLEWYQKQAYNSIGGRDQNEIPFELAPLYGELKEQYLHDMNIVQKYAELNREAIKDIILRKSKLHEVDSFSTIHNYIDINNMILRKGAVSAQKEEQLLIPLNMRDGSLICTGLGNEDWNMSAPHSAGRLFSRSDVKNNFTLSQFKKEMNGIYTSSINTDTLDESPMVYKPIEEIINNIGDSVQIVKRIYPIYNFKAN